MKHILITVLTINFLFCYYERPTGHSFSEEGTRTAFWGSMSSEVDDIGENFGQRFGFDFSPSKCIEFSFDII